MVRSSSRRTLALAPLAAALACATQRPAPPPPPREEIALATQVQAPGFLFELLYTPPDAGEVPRVASALISAGAKLARWGTFRGGIRVRIFPDHAALEAAVERRGYEWLRAWAFVDQVLLQSPRTWPAEDLRFGQEQLTELLAHELTHALMYQLLESPANQASPEQPPLWFREGMASVTAGQGHRRLTIAALAEWTAAHPGADLLHPTPELYRGEKEAVYSAAHRTFELLLLRCGDPGVRELLRGVHGGLRFEQAFRSAASVDLAAFERAAVRGGFDPVAVRYPTASTGAGGP